MTRTRVVRRSFAKVGQSPMNKYELLYIVSSQYTDGEIVKIQEQVNAEVISLGGTVVSSQNLGKIRLAYPIKKQWHGSYVLMYFDAEPSAIASLDRKLTLTDEVLRHTIITRQTDTQKMAFELTSYVAPLSEEARRERHKEHGEEAPRPAPRHKVEELPAPTPSVSSSAEKKMSIEELDKKLDEILDVDVTSL